MMDPDWDKPTITATIILNLLGIILGVAIGVASLWITIIAKHLNI